MKEAAPSRRSRHLAQWSGRLFVWGPYGLYLGPTFRTERHAHHAVQLCIALDGSLRFHIGSARKWSATPAALIASDEPHQIDGGGRLVAFVFLDPESPAARALLGGARATVLGIEESLHQQLLSCWREGCPPDGAAWVCDKVVSSLVPDAGTAPPLDPRIARALNVLRSAPDRRMALAGLAKAVAMSESRLVHLFRRHTGIPIRRYLLWLRLSDALRQAGLGRSLTAIAHGTGFADSAHLCRTFRRMLGLAPSALLKE